MNRQPLRIRARPFHRPPHAPEPVRVLRTRLAPPALTATCLARPGLLERLDDAASRRLVLLTGPCGSGKTTLLAQWYAHASPVRQIAWLSADELDTTAARFLTHLQTAIEPFCWAGTALRRTRHDTCADSLLEQLAATDVRLTIVIDDLHLASQPATLSTLSFLIRRSPPDVQWMIGTRTDDGLPTAELALAGSAETIDHRMLRFSEREVREQASLMQLQLSDPVLRAVFARHEGWIAGTRAALLSAGPEPEREAATLTRYFDANVLTLCSPDTRRFLAATAMLQSFNQELCRAVVPGVDAGELFACVLRDQLFVLSAPTTPNWHQYQQSFGDYLRARLGHEVNVAELHRCAGEWFAARDQFDDALHHLQTAGAREHYRVVLSRAVRRWLREGDLRAVLKATANLTRDEITYDEQIAPARIAGLILTRHFRAAGAALNDVEQRAVLSAALRRRLAVLHAMLALLSCDATFDATALQSIPGDDGIDSYLTGTLLTLQSYRELKRYRFAAARRCALRATEVFNRSATGYGASHAQLLICVADRALGDTEASARRCEQLFAQNEADTPAWINAAGAMALMRYEQNRLDEALSLCDRVLPQLTEAATPDNLAMTFVTAARLLALRGDDCGAGELLDRLHSTLESHADDGLLALVCYEKIRLQLSSGHREAARAVATDFDLAGRVASTNGNHYETAHDRFACAQALLHLDDRDHAACRRLLGDVITRAAAVGYAYRLVPLHAMRSACEWRAGDEAAAFAHLNRAHALTRKVAFTRSVFDDAPGFAEVMRTAMDRNKLQLPLPQGYVQRCPDLFGTDAPVARCSAALPLEPLTLRELEILRLVAQGCSNQQISAATTVALATVKWHLTNVFTKLAVSSRTAAIARVRELQLRL